MRTAVRTPASTSATITTTTTAIQTPPAGNGTRAPPGTPGIGTAALAVVLRPCWPEALACAQAERRAGATGLSGAGGFSSVKVSGAQARRRCQVR